MSTTAKIICPLCGTPGLVPGQPCRMCESTTPFTIEVESSSSLFGQTIRLAAVDAKTGFYLRPHAEVHISGGKSGVSYGPTGSTDPVEVRAYSALLGRAADYLDGTVQP